MSKRVAIAGGGLAGLTCAKDLVDAGYEVSLFEGLPHLGGRASTYRDEDGDWVEQGLHLFFGVYSEFKALLRGIGVDPDAALFWMSELRLQDPEGPQARFGINPVAAPVRTLAGILGNNRYIGPLDKLALLPVVAPGLLGMETLRRRYDGMTVKAWWQKTSGDEVVMERVIRPICRGIQFSEPEDFSAYNFLGWVHHVSRDLPHAFAGGYRGARDETIFAPLGRYLHERGATIRTGAKLASVDVEAGNASGALPPVRGFTLEGGERVEADAYVVAVPVWAFVPLVPEPYRAHPFFANLSELPVCPAISVQLFFDRRIVHTPEFTLVARSRAAVYQDQCDNAYPHPAGSRLSFIVSPADDMMGMSDEAIVEEVMSSLVKVQPEAASAKIRKSVVLKHEKHLVRPLPGAMSRRPTQRTPVENLFLAGDWTQQEFFGSQEGAVRSGRACAAEVLRALAAARRAA